MRGTGTSVLGVFLLVWVQEMDRYEHSGVSYLMISLIL